MRIGLEKVAHFCLIVYLLPVLLQGLEIPDPKEVEYIRTEAKGVVGGTVMLECGSTLPNIYIWGYTRPGSDSNQAVVYNYGQGPKVQQLASSLGELSVLSNTSSLIIDKIPLAAEGLYTCQALYDTAEGARVAFYFVQLKVSMSETTTPLP